MNRAVAQTATAHGDTAIAVASSLQRSCVCGAAAGVNGRCSPCTRASRMGIQGKLTLGAPGDRYEQEADRIADQILSRSNDPSSVAETAAPVSTTPLVQRQSAEDEEETLQAKPASLGAAGTQPIAVRRAERVTAAGGRPLSSADRHYFEPRFGRDLSHVRLHTGPEAQSAARGINARAYTLGNHIAFASGQYEPATARGRHLLAHELAHTFQQKSAWTIRRTCPSDPEKIPDGSMDDFETRAAEALEHKTYKKKLNAEAREIARHIIDGARGSACPMYYIEKLHLLLDTKKRPGKKLAAENREKTKEAAENEVKRLTDPTADALTGVEEAIATASEPNFEQLVGWHGKLFEIDRSDPTRVVVRMKVRLRPQGIGKQSDVDRTEQIEDAIEIESSTHGYTLDIDFVKHSGKDVFTVGVDPSQWTTAGNWVGDAKSIAHEAHHLLGLKDRYNYIEAHAGNKNMIWHHRLFWFREQMVRALDPLASQSKMEDHRTAASMNDQDICALVGGDFDACLAARLDDLPIQELEERAKPLKTSYIPQNAGMLERLRGAWDRKPIEEKTADCNDQDPLCGMAPEFIFGDPNIIGPDADSFPLANPHVQPSGRDLKRTEKPK